MRRTNATTTQFPPVSAGPLIGHGRDDVRAGIRRFAAGRYLTVDRCLDDAVNAGGERVDAAVLASLPRTQIGRVPPLTLLYPQPKRWPLPVRV